jgi:hypothetical protein
MNWGMGKNFEAQPTRTMPRATTRGDGMTDTAMSGLGSSNGKSAWKEAGRSARRRTPEQTLEGSNPRRDAINSAEAQPMARSMRRRGDE